MSEPNPYCGICHGRGFEVVHDKTMPCKCTEENDVLHYPSVAQLKKAIVDLESARRVTMNDEKECRYCGEVEHPAGTMCPDKPDLAGSYVEPPPAEPPADYSPRSLKVLEGMKPPIQRPEAVAGAAPSGEPPSASMLISIDRFNILSRLEQITPEQLAEQMHEACKDEWFYSPWKDFPQVPKDFAIKEAALFLKVMRG